MSLLQELGARLRATSDDLPTGLVVAAMEKLRTATELLNWVRETSQSEMGVPRLGSALEHTERAAAALRVAQDSIAAYLAALGLGAEPGAPAGQEWRAGLERAEQERAPDEQARPETEKLGPWWQERVAQLTGERPPGEPDAAERGGPDKAPGTAELLRRVAAGVRAGDRARVSRDLHSVNASTGLALSAVTSPVLHRLAGDLLGHEPRPEDVPRLRTAAEGRVRAMLPGTSPAVLETLIARICRVPVRQRDDQPAGHPADSAVTAGVLTGVLLARLGRDADALDPHAPEPIRRERSVSPGAAAQAQAARRATADARRAAAEPREGR